MNDHMSSQAQAASTLKEQKDESATSDCEITNRLPPEPSFNDNYCATVSV